MGLFRRNKAKRGSREDRLLGIIQAILDRDLDAAETTLREIAEEDSEQIAPMLALASLYRTRGELGRAIRIHQNLMQRPDGSAAQRVAALRGVAEDFRQGGFLQRAIAAYEELRQALPRDPEVHAAQTELYAKLKDYPRAIKSRRRLAHDLPDVPTEAALYSEWAALHLSRGEEDEAARALRKALRKDPELASAWVALGDLESSRGRHKKARHAWERALDLDSRNARALLEKLKGAYDAEGRGEAFEALLAERVEANPLDVDSALARVRSAWHAGDTAVAVGRLDKILKEHPTQLEALAWRARIVAGQDASPEVGEAWDAVIAAFADEGRFERRGRLV